MTLPKFEDVSFSIKTHYEECPVLGHFSDNRIESGDNIEKRILARLESGDSWAWNTVEVVAEFEDCKGSDFLGCCSYENEADFREGGYFEDMKQEAYRELILNVFSSRQKKLALELVDCLQTIEDRNYR